MRDTNRLIWIGSAAIVVPISLAYLDSTWPGLLPGSIGNAAEWAGALVSAAVLIHLVREHDLQKATLDELIHERKERQTRAAALSRAALASGPSLRIPEWAQTIISSAGPDDDDLVWMARTMSSAHGSYLNGAQDWLGSKLSLDVRSESARYFDTQFWDRRPDLSLVAEIGAKANLAMRQDDFINLVKPYYNSATREQVVDAARGAGLPQSVVSVLEQSDSKRVPAQARYVADALHQEVIEDWSVDDIVDRLNSDEIGLP